MMGYDQTIKFQSIPAKHYIEYGTINYVEEKCTIIPMDPKNHKPLTKYISMTCQMTYPIDKNF